MNWTTEKPTKSGWYWMRYVPRDQFPSIIQVLHDGACLCVNNDGDTVDDVCTAWPHSQWAGPIPEPKEAA